MSLNSSKTRNRSLDEFLEEEKKAISSREKANAAIAQYLQKEEEEKARQEKVNVDLAHQLMKEDNEFEKNQQKKDESLARRYQNTRRSTRKFFNKEQQGPERERQSTRAQEMQRLPGQIEPTRPVNRSSDRLPTRPVNLSSNRLPTRTRSKCPNPIVQPKEAKKRASNENELKGFFKRLLPQQQDKRTKPKVRQPMKLNLFQEIKSKWNKYEEKEKRAKAEEKDLREKQLQLQQKLHDAQLIKEKKKQQKMRCMQRQKETERRKTEYLNNDLLVSTAAFDSSIQISTRQLSFKIEKRMKKNQHFVLSFKFTVNDERDEKELYLLFNVHLFNPNKNEFEEVLRFNMKFPIYNYEKNGSTRIKSRKCEDAMIINNMMATIYPMSRNRIEIIKKINVQGLKKFVSIRKEFKKILLSYHFKILIHIILNLDLKDLYIKQEIYKKAISIGQSPCNLKFLDYILNRSKHDIKHCLDNLVLNNKLQKEQKEQESRQGKDVSLAVDILSDMLLDYQQMEINCDELFELQRT